MLLYQRFVPGLAISSYVVGDEKTGEAVVIDPVRDVEPYLSYARTHRLKIRHVVETHIHADFVSGSAELIAQLGSQVVEQMLQVAVLQAAYVDRSAIDNHTKSRLAVTPVQCRLYF